MNDAAAEPCEVVPYSAEQLRALLAAKSGGDPASIRLKRHTAVFEDYFVRLEAATVVVENHYTDRDYLEDYAGYYVRCFHEYPRRCCRLHFFSARFTQVDLDSLLSGSPTDLSPDALNAAYLGFIVVKPLPKTPVGRTCLKTYAPYPSRCYPVTRKYHANLFGIPLVVDSLAFQEQDSVAAACATSALWSAFHGTCIRFQHPMPPPIQITEAANTRRALDTRTLPNKQGLTAEQMADAIRYVGLQPLAVRAAESGPLLSTLYAYLRGRIPLLLLAWMRRTKPAENLGLHVVTVAGFNLGRELPQAYPGSTLMLRACRIDKIYAHDDQVGPFARMTLQDSGAFATSWPDGVEAQPELLLVPLYHKIRIPFTAIFEIVSSFASMIEEWNGAGFGKPVQVTEWDIHLTDVNAYKQEAFASPHLDAAQKRDLLMEDMPRFLWRATALHESVPALDLLFDATDIEQGHPFLRAVSYSEEHIAAVWGVATTIPEAESVTRKDHAIIEWLKSAVQ